MKIIGITGKARSGKDTVGNWLVSKGFYQYAFANPLKDAAAIMFGIPRSWFDDPTRKEQIITQWGFSPRVILQRLGTEAGRELFCQDIWTRRADIELKAVFEALPITFSPFTGLVVTDVRFEDEAAWIRAKGGQVWHVQRRNAPDVASHKSEAGVSVLAEDAIIDNNGTLQDLFVHINETIDHDS